MEPKLFFDVFPTIEVDQSITGLLGQTRIVRLGSADNGQIVRIYMTSDHLFTYRQATMVRNAIESKLSSNGRVRVYLYFKYNLSAQYNIPKLYDVYQDSILEEMKENDRVLYDMLNNASVDCSGDHDMHITLENGILQKEKTAKLEAVLTKIWIPRPIRAGPEAGCVILSLPQVPAPVRDPITCRERLRDPRQQAKIPIP